MINESDQKLESRFKGTDSLGVRREGISMIELLDDRLAKENAAKRKERIRKAKVGGISAFVIGTLLWGGIITGGAMIRSDRQRRFKKYQTSLELVMDSKNYIGNEAFFEQLSFDLNDENNPLFDSLKSKLGSVKPVFLNGLEENKRELRLSKYISELNSLKNPKSYIESDSKYQKLLSTLNSESHSDFDKLKSSVAAYYNADFKKGVNKELTQLRLIDYKTEFEKIKSRPIINYNSSKDDLEILISKVADENGTEFKALKNNIIVYVNRTLPKLKQDDLNKRKLSSYSSEFMEVQKLMKRNLYDKAAKKNQSLMNALNKEKIPGGKELLDETISYHNNSITPALKRKNRMGIIGGIGALLGFERKVNESLYETPAKIVDTKPKQSEPIPAPRTTKAHAQIGSTPSSTVVKFDDFENITKPPGWEYTFFEDGGSATVSSANKRNGRSSLEIIGTDITANIPTARSRIGVEFYEWTKTFDASESSDGAVSLFSGYSYYAFCSGKYDKPILFIGANAHTQGYWRYISSDSKEFKFIKTFPYLVQQWDEARDFPEPTPAQKRSWHKFKIEIYGPEGKVKFWHDNQYKGEIDIPPTNDPINIFRHKVGSKDRVFNKRDSACVYGYLDDVKFYDIRSSE